MNFDAITVGGGLAGSSIAKQLALNGRKILVLERETRFKDRVRGENMLPWGVSVARRLGILDDLLAAGAVHVPYWITYIGGVRVEARDLRITTPHGESSLNIYHPDMQEAMLQVAVRAGAELIRGATVLGVDSGPDRDPCVLFEVDGQRRTLNARLVIGADGRASHVRGWANFSVQRNPELLMIAGVLIQGTDVPEDAIHLFFGNGLATLFVPLSNKRARIYVVYPGINGRKGLSGNEKVSEFFQLSKAAGAPSSWFTNVEPIGPLAEFSGADHWVDAPAKNGVALIGDAAASSDPSWGSGLALTLVDVEHLAKALLSSEHWNTSLERYAKEHDQYYGALNRILGWMTELFWSYGPSADQHRAKVFSRMKEDPRGFPDSIGLGPFGPSDDQAKRLILGLD